MDGEGRLVALEPLPANLAALREWRASRGLKHQVRIVEAAVGAGPGMIELSAGEGADPRAHAADTRGSVQAAVDSLDRLLAEEARVDFIKLDIEGAEPEALEGAAETLRRDKPKLAIAGYHRADHLWQLPRLLDEIIPGYRVHLGHHPSAVYECEFFCAHPDRQGA
jgi:FkbM family methyltransferase